MNVTGGARSVGLLALIAAAFTFGCARAVAVGSADPSLNYSVDVRNESPVAMIVNYNDGRGDALLGTVRPGGTERFIIASPATTTITITGTGEAGSRRSGPHTVTLGADRPVIVLR